VGQPNFVKNQSKGLGTNKPPTTKGHPTKPQFNQKPFPSLKIFPWVKLKIPQPPLFGPIPNPNFPLNSGLFKVLGVPWGENGNQQNPPPRIKLPKAFFGPS